MNDVATPESLGIDSTKDGWLTEYLRVQEVDHQANAAKLEQLIADAYAKELEGQDKAYWVGVQFGLRRALNVIRGNG